MPIPLEQFSSDAYKHKELTERIIGVFYDVYNELGDGFLESVYETAFSLALAQAGLRAKQQVPVPVWFRGQQIGEFRADLIVEDLVLVEMKAARALDSSHEAQLLNYLRATQIEVGLLLNFGPKPECEDSRLPTNEKGSALICVHLRRFSFRLL